MKLVFFGSPGFAVPSLRRLHGAGHSVMLVVTRPDRPRGRSGMPMATAVKVAAGDLGLPFFQPADPNAPGALAHLRGEGAELGVVVAYGEILSAEALATTSSGFLNLHASLLPDYRGAAPINWAIMRGEQETGVSVIRMAPRLDAGPVLAERPVRIGPDETAGQLEARLADMGAELLDDVVGRLARGELPEGREQPRRTSFFARRLTKEDGRIDWSAPAAEIHNRVRGLSPWPGAYCQFEGNGRNERVHLLRVRSAPAGPQRAEPGTVLQAGGDGIFVKAGAGVVRILEVKPAGSRAMAAADFVNGRAVRAGDRFA
jgi:methionyl-tRNA formyltransferase